MAKVGRPTKFKPEYVEQARKLAILGATTPDLADFFDVATSTIEKWQKEIPEFSGALKAGKDEVDAQVTKSLFKRATGWEHKAVKIFADAKTGAEQIVPYIERYPPDTTAAIFWLKNRRPDLWRDMQQREHTGPGGKPLNVSIIGPPSDD